MGIWTKISGWRRRIGGAPRSSTPAALTLLGLIALVLAVPAAAIAADVKAPISTAYCIDCVPFQFRDENGAPAGLIIDLWRLWSEKTGIEIEFSRPERREIRAFAFPLATPAIIPWVPVVTGDKSYTPKLHRY